MQGFVLEASMELKKGTGEWISWWEVVRPNARVLEFVRRSIPSTFRTFAGESGNQRWYVHDKYADQVRQIMNSSGTTALASDDPWAVLHLRPGAPQAIIKAVWRELAKTLHPDRGGDPEQFKRASEAYEKLSKV